MNLLHSRKKIALMISPLLVLRQQVEQLFHTKRRRLAKRLITVINNFNSCLGLQLFRSHLSRKRARKVKGCWILRILLTRSDKNKQNQPHTTKQQIKMTHENWSLVSNKLVFESESWDFWRKVFWYLSSSTDRNRENQYTNDFIWVTITTAPFSQMKLST